MSATTRRLTTIPRSRGVVTGIIIFLLGVWGGIVPFVGPYFHYAFGTYASFHFTWERLWLDIVPGAAAIVGGALLILAASRPTGVFAGWLAAAAGAWFVVGVSLSTLWQGAGHFGIGPALGGRVHQAAEWVGFFYGLGATIILLAAFSMGRLSVLSVRDVRAADARTEPPTEHRAERAAPEDEVSAGASVAPADGAISEHKASV
jgi:hypothetical protein